MNKKSSAPLEPKLYRLIDANLNRLKEGIRVIEDIERYIFDNEKLAKRLKTIRHQASFHHPKLLEFRDIRNDVLKSTIETEKNRSDIEALLLANIKRAQESARVLEEAFKLIEIELSERFKTIRYELYDIEKELFHSSKKTL